MLQQITPRDQLRKSARSVSDGVTHKILKTLQMKQQKQSYKVLLNAKSDVFSFSEFGNDIWDAYVKNPNFGPSKMNPTCDRNSILVRGHPALVLAYELFGQRISGPNTMICLMSIKVPDDKTGYIELIDDTEQIVLEDNKRGIKPILPESEYMDLYEFFKWVHILYNKNGQRRFGW
jgi:hypothetical protein